MTTETKTPPAASITPIAEIETAFEFFHYTPRIGKDKKMVYPIRPSFLSKDNRIGGFTSCAVAVTIAGHTETSVGYSLCCVKDNFNKVVGRKRALSAAISHFPKSVRAKIWTDYFNATNNKKSYRSFRDIETRIPAQILFDVDYVGVK